MKKESIHKLSTNAVPEEYRKLFLFSEFNEVQSACFNLVMKTEENIMLSAPTGSGKTIVSELAIINELMKSAEPILMIYIAPLRALCQERVRDWTNRLSKVGVAVMEYTGDSTTRFPTSFQTNILLCTTPEKLDLATRHWKQRSASFTRLRLVIADEIHSIGESRGAVLEATLTRLLFISDFNHEHSEARAVRIVALSATVPNTGDIGRWLRAPSFERTSFGESFRPVPVERTVIGYREAANEWLFESSLTARIGSVIREYGVKGGEVIPTLVFCATRKSCEKTAERIILDVPELSSSSSPLVKTKDKALSKLIRRGVAIHTAGLSPEDRATVESLFGSGEVRVVCATSTLAAGVNLPAALVVLKGTAHWADGALREYDAGAILQMVGRAGRPQFCASGRCVIMTTRGRAAILEGVIGSQSPVESVLLPELKEHINAEAALGTIRSDGDARRWVGSTFLAVRFPRNPSFYGASGERAADFLGREAARALGELERLGLIRREAGRIEITEVGEVASARGLRAETAGRFAVSRAENVGEVLLELSGVREFDDVIVRAEDRQKLRVLALDPSTRPPPFSASSTDLRSFLRNDIEVPQPDEDGFFSPRTKVLLMAMAAVGAGRIEDFSLSQEFGRVSRVGERLLAGFADITAHRGKLCAALAALSLRRSLAQRMWEDTCGRAASQVRGIGEVNARKLEKEGIGSIEALRRSTAAVLERATGHRPGWGVNIKAEISKIPDYSLSLRIVDNGGTNSVRATLANRSPSDPGAEHGGCDVFVLCGETLSRFHTRVVGHLSASFDVPIDGYFPGATAFAIDSIFIGIDAVCTLGIPNSTSNTGCDRGEAAERVSPVSCTAGHPGQTRASFPPAPTDEVVWELPLLKRQAALSETVLESETAAVEAEAAKESLSADNPADAKCPEINIDEEGSDFWDGLEFDE